MVVGCLSEVYKRLISMRACSMHLRLICLWRTLLGLGWEVGAHVFGFVQAWVIVFFGSIHVGKMIRIHRIT